MDINFDFDDIYFKYLSKGIVTNIVHIIVNYKIINQLKVIL